MKNKIGNPGKIIQQNCKISTYVEPNIAAIVERRAESKAISISEYVKRIIYKELGMAYETEV